MKPLYDNKLSINSDGVKISEDFHMLLRQFSKKHSLCEYNPIELNHVLTAELAIQTECLYCDMVETIFHES